MLKFALLLIALAAPLAAQDLSLVVTKVERKVEVSRNEGAWEPATKGMKLLPGDRIHTGFKAVCGVKFPDGSALEVKPMSLVLLQKLQDGDGGRLKSRVWLRLGEVSAQVNRSSGAAADFNVKTPTSTASVRGTVINRICYHAGVGTVVEMGNRGLLSVGNARGRVALPRNQATQATHTEDAPTTPERWRLATEGAQIQPQGTSQEELDDIRDAGVPKTNPFTTGGSGFLSNIAVSNQLAIQPAPTPAASLTRVTVNVPVLP